jgi:hypothetical protein
MAVGGATPRRGGGRSVHAGSSLHDSDFHWLSACRSPGGCGGNARDLPARLCSSAIGSTRPGWSSAPV